MAAITDAESSRLPARRDHFWDERRIAYAVLIFCAICIPVLRFWFMANNSATIDELVHIESGYRYWQCGDYGVSPENPPVAKLVAAFPVRHWQLTGFLSPCGTQVTPSRGPDYFVAVGWLHSSIAPLLLWKARTAMIVFPLLLLILVFFAARSFFGYTAATVAAILLVFEPTLIAHGSLATIDMASATCAFAGIWAAYGFASKPSLVRLILLGIAMGLALASKFLDAVLPIIALIVILLPDLRRGIRWRNLLRKVAAWIGACLIAAAVVWGTYGFRYSALPHSAKSNYDFVQLFKSTGLSQSFWPALTSFLANYRLLPEAYIAGLATMKTFDAGASYFFGNVYPEGLWYYYPAALLIKLTVSVITLAIVAIASRRLWRANRRAMLTLLVSAGFCMGLVMMGKVNMGVRHVLPVYPLLVLLAAASAATLLSRSRTAASIAVVLIAWHVFSSLHSAPRQISYANELLGGSNQLYKYLGDSNLDWGQSDDEIGAYVRSHHLDSCAIAWFAPHRSSPPCMGLPTLPNDIFRPAPPPTLPDSFTGTILVQPSAVFWTDGYLPFLRRKPDDIFAHGSVLVYKGTFDLHALAAVRHMFRGMWMMFFMHDIQHALDEFAAADPYCPDLNRPQNEQFYAMALLQMHRPAEAKMHFQKLLELTKGHPGWRSLHEAAVEALKKL